MTEKSVPIVLGDGKTRHLRFEWEYICRLEREYGISLFDFGKDAITGSLSPVKATGIIWAGLLPEEETLTIEEVEKLMKFSDFPKYMDALIEAIPSSLALKKATRPSPRKIIPSGST